MNKIKTLVVDDETANRRLICKLIDELHSDFEVIGQAGNINDAEDMIKKKQPDLVFLDIKMPGGSGFDLLERFDVIPFELAFITGFDSYAVKAFEFNAIDYILKPVNPLKFSRALLKIHARFQSKQAQPEDIKELLQTFDPKKTIISRIPVHTGSKVVLLNIADLVMVQSEDRCVSFKTLNNERYTSAKELADFAFILEKYDFMLRISKSTYVNTQHVTGYTKGEPCILLLKNDINIEIPRRKKAELLSILFKE